MFHFNNFYLWNFVLSIWFSNGNVSLGVLSLKPLIWILLVRKRISVLSLQKNVFVLSELKLGSLSILTDMENINKFWLWLRTLPVWLRAIVLAFIAVLALIASLSFTACGTPKTVATVQNVNPNSSVTVTMTVSNSTTSTPSVDTDTSLNK